MSHCADFHTGMKVAHSMAKQTRIPELLQFSRKFQGQSSSSSSPSSFLWLVLRLYPFVCPPTNRISTWNKKRVNTRSRLSEYMGVWHETKFQRQKLYHRWIAAMGYIYIYIYIYTVPPLKIILLAYFDDDNDIITRRKLNCEKWNVRIFPSPSIKLSSSSNNLARVYRGGIIFCCVFLILLKEGKWSILLWISNFCVRIWMLFWRKEGF